MESREHEILSKFIDAGTAIAIIYISMNPDILGIVIERTYAKIKEWQHSFSIGQAIRAIRNLPETEVTDETEVET